MTHNTISVRISKPINDTITIRVIRRKQYREAGRNREKRTVEMFTAERGDDIAKLAKNIGQAILNMSPIVRARKQKKETES